MHLPIKRYSAGPGKANWFAFLLRVSLMITLSVVIPRAYAIAGTQATYYVDPTYGNDTTNSGTSLGSAFKTIGKARDVVRTINSNMTGDIYVYLRGGTYWLDSTINFTDSDGGTNGFNIIYSSYNGEKVIISGGKQITGWSLHDTCQNIYKAYAGNIETRQLFVNGVRAIRARSTVGLSGASFVKASGYTKSGNMFVNSPIPMHLWENITDVEFLFSAAWTAPRVPVDTVTNDGTTTTITMQQPSWYWACNKGASSVGGTYNNGYPLWIENAYELLDAEGEWYMNRVTDTIYYKPRIGEDLSTTPVIAPILVELIRVQGSDPDHKAHNMQFKGITFSHTTDLYANCNMGHIDSQNDITIDSNNVAITMSAAVNLKYANSIRFERDVFEHLGNTGLNLYAGSQDNLILGSRFTDLSGNGIQAGNYGPASEDSGGTTDSLLILRNNDVINNYINSIGQEYYSSTAIGATFPQDMDIVHNEIGNTPYSGMHIGYYNGLAHKNTRIQKNYVHDVMRSLIDGGCIYTLGVTGGDSAHLGLISNNYLQNQYHEFNAMYCDNSSNWWSLDSNVINSVPTYYGGNGETHITVTNTFTNQSNVDVGGASISGTTVVSGAWPAPAQAIIDSAGLQQPYLDIKPSSSTDPSQKLNENFDAMNEGYPPTGWTINNAGGDGTVTVAGVPTPTNKSMTLSKTGSASGQDLVSSHAFTAQVSGTAEVTAMAEQTNADIRPVILKSGSTSAIEIAFRSTGQISYKNASGTWVDIQAYTAGTWYKFKLEFDVVPDTYNLYIDSVQKLTNVAFAQASDALDSIAYQIKAASTGVVHIDSVKVYDGYVARAAVSTGKTITGFSSQYNSTSLSANNIDDGVLSASNQGWSSAGAPAAGGEWVTIDLGQTYTLNSFTVQSVFAEDNVNVKDYVLYGSATGAFTGEEFVLSSGTLPSLPHLGSYSALITPTDARYIKFKGTTAYGAFMKVGELTLYGVSNSADPLPTVTASSTFSSSYVPYNAIDGNIGNGVGEWAASGELNPWIKLTWTQPRTISNIVLYDRANTTDNANGGTLTFSDGSSITVTGIPTDGSAKIVQFPSKTATWVQFQVSGGSGANVGLAEIKVNDRLNVAPTATVTASSQYSSATAPALATDGKVQSSGSEWASNAELNPWIQLNWSQNETINKIILYDRFNTSDWAPGGTLTFSDGSSLTVSGIQNNGRGYTVAFPDKTVTWVKFQVAGGSGANVGLTEIEVYGIDSAAVITASSQFSSSFTPAKANDGYVGNSVGEWASSGELNPWIRYTWTQNHTIDNIVLYDRINSDNANGGTLTFSDGSSVTVTGIPTDGSPKLVHLATPISVTWAQFQVSGGSGANVGLSEMKVNDRPNVAPNATVTASSQYSSSFVPSNAVDGKILSSGGEWASHGELNPWIQLNWTAGQTISKITFYDRFNTSDWAPGGTLTFSDGSTVTVSGIQNDGKGYTVTFPDKTVTWVKFQVAGGSGANVGLTEIEVY